MVQQGGMPTAPSATFSGYADHRIAHALDLDEVAWLVREYGESAALAIDAGVDAIEIHANHDDVVQWFLSPATNFRTDGYGGSFDNRRRFLREITETIRNLSPRPFTFGLRLNLDEMIEGGYGIDTCQRLVEAFTADGTVDYFSFDVGGNWDAPSYIPIAWYDDAQWSPLCAAAKQATNLPVVYAGRVTSVEQAEQVLTDGHADLVAMARASMADPDLVNKARGDNQSPTRPCIGLNECIHRKTVDGLAYACGVSTTFAREHELRNRPMRTESPRSVLVVGGGPGGSEFAAL
jgi:2,4-dienoyl-CoA reductase-like NADH-dependent reductase (Old Yellow Enzyme family)